MSDISGACFTIKMPSPQNAFAVSGELLLCCCLPDCAMQGPSRTPERSWFEGWQHTWAGEESVIAVFLRGFLLFC